MSSFAIFIIIVVLVAGALGWHAGLLRQVGRIAGVILGILTCRLWGADCVVYLFGTGASGTEGLLYTVLTYIILFLVVYFGAWVLVRLVRGLVGTVKLGVVDRLCGALFRIMEWLLLLSLLLNLWQSIAPIRTLADDTAFRWVLGFGPWLLGTDMASQIGGLVGGAIGV